METTKKVRFPSVMISPEAEDLIRSRMRRKGDLSRLVEEAILKTYRAVPTS